ncbi:MAG: GTPase HflX [Planctomycetes bacterium]|nr:GTPase HflX [Planctomycetota bacterium]
MKQDNNNLNIRLDRALLLGLELYQQADDLEGSLDELALLADTAGVEVVGRLCQRKQKIDPGLYVGKGKAQEASEYIIQNNVDLLIVDDDLRPAQQRNLEKLVGVRVIDRTELILSIFAWRARTHQAKVQVELAQLNYSLPRLRKMWTHLTSEQERAATGIMGGAGERQIELDRRMIRQKIRDLKRELVQIRDRKSRSMSNRDELFTVTLVGYTNAGKSTLMNALTDANVFVEDKLFATLDTRTRIWKLAPGHRCLLSDTVGFIRKLPHHLVEAFNATLQEAMTADFLLHVVDCSSVHVEKHIAAAQEVLERIDAHNISSLIVFNKVDLLEPNDDAQKKLEVLQTLYPQSIAVSAKVGLGIEELKNKILLELRKSWISGKMQIHHGNGKLIGILKDETEIQREEYKEKHVEYDVFFDPRIISKIEEAAFKTDILDYKKPESKKDRQSKPDFYVPPK